jgi:transposase-like protein
VYCDHTIEQDHRGIKQRYYPMRGFGSFNAAARFCTAHDELRDHLRVRTRMHETVSLAEQRCRFQEQWVEVWALLQAA